MPEESSAVATDAQSTDDLVKSLGWDISEAEKLAVEELDKERDTMDVDFDTALEKYKQEQAVIQAAAQQDQEVADQIGQMAKDYRDKLVRDDWSVEAANDMARTKGESAWSFYQGHKATTALNDANRVQDDLRIQKEYGIDPKLLSTFTDPEARESMAQFLGQVVKGATDAKKAAEASITKAAVQSQDSGNGTPGAANTKEQQKADYSTGKIELTRADFKDLYGYWP